MAFDGRASQIMVAEHDRTVLELLQLRLQVAGHHPIGVRTGAEAIGIFKNMQLDGVVLDLQLPDMEGLDVLKILKRRPGRRATPVLIIGRELSAETIRRAVGLGARDCLSKPFSGADALDRIARMLRAPQPPATVAAYR